MWSGDTKWHRTLVVDGRGSGFCVNITYAKPASASTSEDGSVFKVKIISLYFIFTSKQPQHTQQPTYYIITHPTNCMQSKLEAYGFKVFSCGGMPGSACAGRDIKVPELFLCGGRVRSPAARRAAPRAEALCEELVPNFSEDGHDQGGGAGSPPSQAQGIPPRGSCCAGEAQRW